MYRVIYHELAKTDLKILNHKDQEKVVRAIKKKLFTRPDYFGKPLGKELHNWYRLRVESYRVVYYIQKDKILVFIIHIGRRKDLEVYIEAARRIKLLPF